MLVVLLLLGYAVLFHRGTIAMEQRDVPSTPCSIENQDAFSKHLDPFLWASMVMIQVSTSEDEQLSDVKKQSQTKSKLFRGLDELDNTQFTTKNVPNDPQKGLDDISVPTCLKIKNHNSTADSGMYTLNTSSVHPIQVYCEMGLNGGGYIFLSPQALVHLSNAELQSMITDKTSFLLRARKTDGTQPYAVLRQLPQYANISLKLGLSDYTDYYPPKNLNIIGQPFLYFGFLPTKNASNNNIQGLRVNNFSNTFKNCDKLPNSHFTLYPNFRNVTPSSYHSPGPFCNNIFSHLLPNPSGRVMPPGMFFFSETHWGGCGCYKQTNQNIANILSLAIGFR